MHNYAFKAKYFMLIVAGVTPFVDPEHPKFFFEEIHRLTV